MGLLGGAMKSGLALKAGRMIKREAQKPENQRKAKSLLGRLTNRSSGTSKGRTSSTSKSRTSGKPKGRTSKR